MLIPSSYIEAISGGRLKREIGSLKLIKNEDAYGNILETEIGVIFETAEMILKETDKILEDFKADGHYGECSKDLEGPGAIPDILDFSKVICFAASTDDSPFCFDYRDSELKPSIIWWDDVYWRKVAPDFESFIVLFNLEQDS